MASSSFATHSIKYFYHDDDEEEEDADYVNKHTCNVYTDDDDDDCCGNLFVCVSVL